MSAVDDDSTTSGPAGALPSPRAAWQRSRITVAYAVGSAWVDRPVVTATSAGSRAERRSFEDGDGRRAEHDRVQQLRRGARRYHRAPVCATGVRAQRAQPRAHLRDLLLSFHDEVDGDACGRRPRGHIDAEVDPPDGIDDIESHSRCAAIVAQRADPPDDRDVGVGAAPDDADRNVPTASSSSLRSNRLVPVRPRLGSFIGREPGEMPGPSPAHRRQRLDDVSVRDLLDRARSSPEMCRTARPSSIAALAPTERSASSSARRGRRPAPGRRLRRPWTKAPPHERTASVGVNEDAAVRPGEGTERSRLPTPIDDDSVQRPRSHRGNRLNCGPIRHPRTYRVRRRVHGVPDAVDPPDDRSRGCKTNVVGRCEQMRDGGDHREPRLPELVSDALDDRTHDRDRR